MKLIRLIDWLLVKDTDLPKHIIKIAAEKAKQAAEDKRARRRARNLRRCP